ncbi:hypothetical protein CDAR_218441 [Caerostris darwini]|uniref:Uncharacterized protein n=1 Tax=Caerostris darwini TaxID=1538125 RepID=A0AAV4RGT8_9ARAC|nr:hypothetical protein CDAR_218441 [Caerostris darwini]
MTIPSAHANLQLKDLTGPYTDFIQMEFTPNCPLSTWTFESRSSRNKSACKIGIALLKCEHNDLGTEIECFVSGINNGNGRRRRNKSLIESELFLFDTIWFTRFELCMRDLRLLDRVCNACCDNTEFHSVGTIL